VKALLATVAALALAAVTAPGADAKPAPKRSAKAITKVTAKPTRPRISPTKKGAAARIAVLASGEMRPARDVIGRRDEPLTLEEETAKQIQKLLRGPLRNGLTGLYVADALTGQPLFAVNADDPLNPASNVKMISTATSLELLGPDFRYPTRLLGPAPTAGAIHGDIYLLGSYDPTLTSEDLDDLAGALETSGVTSIEGDIVVGTDPTRDGIFRAIIPLHVTAGEPGQAPTVAIPFGADHVSVTVTAKTARRAQRPHLTYKTTITKSQTGIPLITVSVGGTIGKGGSTMYPLWTRERTATAAYALRASLRAHNISITGDYKLLELGDYIGDSVATGSLPVELARHESQRLADIVSRINKWSINWLADRVVMTASALAHHAPPTMDLAIDSMYGWLARHANLTRKDLLIDTGSGLSYRTQITPTELVAIVRAAGGFSRTAGQAVTADDSDPIAKAWLDSLSIAGHDGTLRHRIRNADLRARIRGKTGTLSTAIAMSGILDIDPTHPLAFSLVTNTDAPLSKRNVRLAHDMVMGTLCHYLAQTTKSPTAPTAPSTAPLTTPVEAAPVQAPSLAPIAPATDEPEETAPGEADLDAEAAGHS
jgi:D-alanyl-D-alanine carboxypeptidase/D-alanyl-D-alanine-endopeptidase (penicillin-binding protein 4)